MSPLVDYDLTGFVNFPHANLRSIKAVDSGLTQVYLVSFSADQTKLTQEIKLTGTFAGDDVVLRTFPKINSNIEDTINNLKKLRNEQFDFYFGHKNTFAVESQILIGWSKFTYEHVDKFDPWICTFRELTPEGRKLYYSMKKLHNESEIRLLTFNSI